MSLSHQQQVYYQQQLAIPIQQLQQQMQMPTQQSSASAQNVLLQNQQLTPGFNVPFFSPTASSQPPQQEYQSTSGE